MKIDDRAFPGGYNNPLKKNWRNRHSLTTNQLPAPWTQGEVAAVLNKSAKTVKRLEQRGFLIRVPGISRPPLYTVQSVEKFLAGGVDARLR